METKEELIYLIYCAKCNNNTGIATNNKNNLTDLPYKCKQCGYEAEKAENYQTTTRDKFLEGFKEIEREEE